ncbi:DUF4232 domain-containing protein [Catenulispora subtropica]|uniref:DUF4232 domain-containing protein n=1 Tax=Catenulispora subtropica TaxID=450798 RepID=A0ABP5E219_9ACTN
MTNRIATRNTNLLAVAAIAASALVGLTACASGAKPSQADAGSPTVTAVGAPSTGQSATGASQSPAGSPATTTGPSRGQTQTASQPSAPKSTPKSSPKTSAKKSAPPSGLAADCTPGQLKATVTALTRPINHVLLTVTNTGNAACSVYYYPGLRFDADQQAETQAVEDSKPQAVITIAPGESGYAAIGTSAADGSGGGGKVEKQVEVFLESRDQSGSLPGSLVLPLPAGTYVDGSAFVTYWQSDLQSAIVW